MQREPRFLIVAEVRKDAGIHIDVVRPVRVVHTGIQHYKAWSVPTAYRSEAALVTCTGYEAAEWIIAGISLRAALVNGIDNQVTGGETAELEDIGHGER